jgi:hypothetical protein
VFQLAWPVLDGEAAGNAFSGPPGLERQARRNSI